MIAEALDATVTAHMATNEGLRRVVIMGKLIVLVGITLSTLCAVTIFGFGNMFQYPIVLDGVAVGLRVAALGGLVWAAGWIAQGFTRPDP